MLVYVHDVEQDIELVYQFQLKGLQDACAFHFCGSFIVLNLNVSGI